MKNNKKKKILITVIVVLIVIILAAVAFLVVQRLGLFSAEKTYREIQESYASALQTTDPTATSGATGTTIPMGSEAPVPTAENPIDFKELREQNTDIYSWIYIPDTNINYPVVQSDYYDNFYLDHDIYKDYSFPGAIYSQSKNKKDYLDRVTVLYGHNMLDGSMFATLYQFDDEEFFDSHPYFYVYTPDRKLTYEVVSVHDYDDKHILNSFDFTKDEVFTDWITAAQNPHSLYSNVRKDVKLDLNSKMLVLSTCTNGGDGRYLLQGVLIKDEKTK